MWLSYRRNVLIISAVNTSLCSPESARIRCRLISEQKRLPVFLVWAELSLNIWWGLLPPAAQAEHTEPACL